jgi:hypothetical protein
MAKLGEGDKRWLVQDLGEAGRNVNGAVPSQETVSSLALVA